MSPRENGNTPRENYQREICLRENISCKVSPRENENQLPAEITKANYLPTKNFHAKCIPTKTEIFPMIHLSVPNANPKFQLLPIYNSLLFCLYLLHILFSDSSYCNGE